MTLIDADVLIRLMRERADDCGEPKNAVDLGYDLAVKHMEEEIAQDNEYHCKHFNIAKHDKEVRNKTIAPFEREIANLNRVDWTEQNLAIFAMNISEIIEQMKEGAESD